MIEKYLDKNYYVKDGYIFKSVGVSTKCSIIIMEISLIFSLSRQDIKPILNNWLINKGFSKEQINKLYPKVEVEFIYDDKTYYLSAEEVSVEAGYNDYANIGNIKTIVRYNGPIFEIKLNSDDNDEEIISKFFELPGFIMSNKFELKLIHNNLDMNEFKHNGCFLSEVKTNYDGIYDVDMAYVGQKMTLTLKIICDY